tara:strand:+ start:534 stop:794 length:261 start_codon:yes stop_codon:yes gene_type:complete
LLEYFDFSKNGPVFKKTGSGQIVAAWFTIGGFSRSANGSFRAVRGLHHRGYRARKEELIVAMRAENLGSHSIEIVLKSSDFGEIWS